MIKHGIKLLMGPNVMISRNVEIPLDVEHQKSPPQSEVLLWARLEGDCEDNSLWVVEPAKIKGDIITVRALVKPCKSKIVPVRVLNLSSYEKIIKPNSELGECASAEAVVNCVEKPVNKSIREYELLADYVEKWVEKLASEKSKAKQFLKRHLSVFSLNSQNQNRTAIVKHQIDTGDARPINQTLKSIPFAKRNEVKEFVNEMERNGVIEPSSSP
ncbi:uncharacterized protein LOC124420072 [Lucilia cuprina]|uniref:uncharacterized protein LOC124420072 n=1 Tax=Lucilia cuprina TaxID=7375 RepID=UPI001F06C4CD|nr:uncharacterized protein LOC124420072 [Lucilia cuprina]